MKGDVLDLDTSDADQNQEKNVEIVFMQIHGIIRLYGT